MELYIHSLIFSVHSIKLLVQFYILVEERKMWLEYNPLSHLSKNKGSDFYDERS